MERAAREYPGCLDCAPIVEVSRQLWSFIGPLIRDDPDKASTYRNVERHNGLEAWRTMAEPVNQDKTLMRKELLTLVNNPVAAKTIDEYEGRLRDWNTNLRLMQENDGVVPSDDQKRAILIDMLPPEVNMYVTLRLEEEAFDSFSKVKAWALRYVKLLQKRAKIHKTV